ncbi:hypothetical protein RZS08_31610, partial [Arthrospira platensis SPKY1]|nr:hypothetical protein [Arthrospira platensis SPKY1]
MLVYEPFFNFLVETPFLVNEQFYFNILPAFSFTIPLQEVQTVDINQIFNISINLAPNILSITDTIEGYLDINNTPSIYSIPNVSNNFPTLSYVGLTIVPFDSSGVQERRNLITANLAVGVEQNPQTYELKTG